MAEAQQYLEFIGVFIGTLLAVSAFTPRGYKAIRVMFQWWKDVTLSDIYERLDNNRDMLAELLAKVAQLEQQSRLRS